MPYSTEENRAIKAQEKVLHDALEIMRSRTGAYGIIWKQYGALANLLQGARKVDRLMSLWWRGDGDDVPELDKSLLDDAYDAINYIAFFIQEAEAGNIVGSIPDRPEDTDYSGLRVIQGGSTDG